MRHSGKSGAAALVCCPLKALHDRNTYERYPPHSRIGRDLQQRVRYAVDQPGNAEVQPCEVPVHLGRKQRGDEHCEQADGARELEGEEDLQLDMFLILGDVRLASWKTRSKRMSV